eukprot:scaffold2135_cov341-Prasinococcus_capsulatus_cf.AAC.14
MHGVRARLRRARAAARPSAAPRARAQRALPSALRGPRGRTIHPVEARKGPLPSAATAISRSPPACSACDALHACVTGRSGWRGAVGPEKALVFVRISAFPLRLANRRAVGIVEYSLDETAWKAPRGGCRLRSVQEWTCAGHFEALAQHVPIRASYLKTGPQLDSVLKRMAQRAALQNPDASGSLYRWAPGHLAHPMLYMETGGEARSSSSASSRR